MRIGLSCATTHAAEFHQSPETWYCIRYTYRTRPRAAVATHPLRPHRHPSQPKHPPPLPHPRTTEEYSLPQSLRFRSPYPRLRAGHFRRRTDRHHRKQGRLS